MDVHSIIDKLSEKEIFSDKDLMTLKTELESFNKEEDKLFQIKNDLFHELTKEMNSDLLAKYADMLYPSSYLSGSELEEDLFTTVDELVDLIYLSKDSKKNFTVDSGDWFLVSATVDGNEITFDVQFKIIQKMTTTINF